jgi:hypothetical protein
VTLGGLFVSLTGFPRCFGPSRVGSEFLSEWLDLMLFLESLQLVISISKLMLYYSLFFL